MERAKGCAFEWGEDLKILLEEGVLAGQFASLAVELEDLTRRLRGSFPLLLCDSLPTSRYLALPRAMLSINARQLPSYGGSIETAAADMEHYLAAGSGVLVLCGNETRARNFHRLLEERGVRARLDLSDQTLFRYTDNVKHIRITHSLCNNKRSCDFFNHSCAHSLTPPNRISDPTACSTVFFTPSTPAPVFPDTPGI